MNDEDDRWKNDPLGVQESRIDTMQLIKSTKRAVSFRTSNKD